MVSEPNFIILDRTRMYPKVLRTELIKKYTLTFGVTR
jgi:hypothetical protein